MDQEYHLLSEEKASLSAEDDQFLQSPIWQNRDRNSQPKLFSRTAIIIHASIFLTYTTLLLVLTAWLLKTYGSQHAVAYTPFNPEPEAIIFNHDHSVYVGEPSRELDEAWNKLLWNSNIRITEDEMSHIPDRKENGIPLPDGGYFATLNTFHNLHCIQRLHHYMYEDHYFPNITRVEKHANNFHNHHCLDMLRQSVMCQADRQILTMKWLSHSTIPTANWSAPHQCVKWDQVQDWAATRRIDQLMQPGYLYHPTLGPAYPGGHGSRIGEVLGPDE